MKKKNPSCVVGISPAFSCSHLLLKMKWEKKKKRCLSELDCTETKSKRWLEIRQAKLLRLSQIEPVVVSYQLPPSRMESKLSLQSISKLRSTYQSKEIEVNLCTRWPEKYIPTTNHTRYNTTPNISSQKNKITHHLRFLDHDELGRWESLHVNSCHFQ